ncbi:hypothetical protein EVAR_51056_1 [Eumeta japonica]|uniref:Uncharacterized protein n=1 Tax=Eumeta variegata TaxID=151549 RepID=A0A4C1ZAQ2_EUMVA|nr:hypothetical protein EVAR_51056_1 [Eumeta japonica]
MKRDAFKTFKAEDSAFDSRPWPNQRNNNTVCLKKRLRRHPYLDTVFKIFATFARKCTRPNRSDNRQSRAYLRAGILFNGLVRESLSLNSLMLIIFVIIETALRSAHVSAHNEKQGEARVPSTRAWLARHRARETDIKVKGTRPFHADRNKRVKPPALVVASSEPA